MLINVTLEVLVPIEICAIEGKDDEEVILKALATLPHKYSDCEIARYLLQITSDAGPEKEYSCIYHDADHLNLLHEDRVSDDARVFDISEATVKAA